MEWSSSVAGKSRLLMMAWISSAWVRGRVAREARLVYGQLKRQGYVGIFTYFEGSISSGEASGLLSFFFQEFRKKETDFIVMNRIAKKTAPLGDQ